MTDLQAVATAQALYGPPALRRFTISQDITNPQEIAIERYRQRLNIHKLQDDPPPHQPHRHFITRCRDRQLAMHEAIGDIRDAVTGIDNLADVMFVGFAIRPEWDLSVPLDPSSIKVEVITSHHMKQHPTYQRAVDTLCKTVQQDLAFPHIYSYSRRLRTVTPPGRGYAVDAETRRLTENEIRLAEGVQPPLSMNSFSGVVSTAPVNVDQPLISPLPTMMSIRDSDCTTLVPSTEPTTRTTENQQNAYDVPSGSNQPDTDPVLVNIRGRPRWVRRGRGRSLRPATLPSFPSHSSSITHSAERPLIHQLPPHMPGPSSQNTGRHIVPTPTSSDGATSRGLRLVPLTQRDGAVIGVVPTSPLPPESALHTVASEPIVISDSDSDDSSLSLEAQDSEEGIVIELTSSEEDSSSSDDSVEHSDAESWVRTPDGSPPRRASCRHMGIVLSERDDPPPEYTAYLQPTVDSFGFHPDVTAFLSRRNLPPGGLVRIESTLNYHMDDWRVGFIEAGLSEVEARQLRTIVVHSLSDLTRDALITAWAVGET